MYKKLKMSYLYINGGDKPTILSNVGLKYKFLFIQKSKKTTPSFK